MAYIIESKLLGTSKDLLDYPYKSALHVVASVCPEFAKDESKIIALCDMSLMSTCAGATFVKFLFEEANDKHSCKTAKDVYDIFYRSKPNSNLGNYPTLIDGFIDLCNMTRNLLKNYIIVPELSNYRQWVDNLFDEVIQFRIRNPFLFINLYEGGYPSNNMVLINFINNIGSPLIQNANKDFYEFRGNRNSCMYIFKALSNIYNLFINGILSCDMMNWCVKSGIAIDNRCRINPWSRCTDKKLCPYAMLWKHWGLSNKVPVEDFKTKEFK